MVPGKQEIGPVPNYEVYDRLVDVPLLIGYGTDENGDRHPVWGDTVAVYNPLTPIPLESGSDKVPPGITYLTDSVRRVMQGIGEGMPTGTLPDRVGIDPDECDTTVADLERRGVIIPAGRSRVLSVQNNEVPEIYIKLGDACNLQCPGCATGEDQRTIAGIRPERFTTEKLNQVLEQMVEATAKRTPDGDRSPLTIKMAGGEPLLQMSLLKGAQDKIRELRTRYASVELAEVIITNGTLLTDENITAIQQMNEAQKTAPTDPDIIVSVSLWGLEQTHNQLRGVRIERDDFLHTVAGIRRLLEAGIPFNIHHVIGEDNAQQFGDFIRTIWDTASDSFLAEDWEWPGGIKQPLPLTLSIFRPQTPEQLHRLQNGGYSAIRNGVRGGFDAIREMIERGVPVPRLSKLDYLRPFWLALRACSTGSGYTAVGPGRVAPCHELLYGGQRNMDRVSPDTDIISLANQGLVGDSSELIGLAIKNPQVDPVRAMILALHGGTGCPITTRLENNGELGVASSISNEVYAHVVDEMIALEALRGLVVSKRSKATL